MDNWYVYVHQSEDGTIKYVGSGRGKRYKSKVARSPEHLSLWEKLDKRVVSEDLSLRKCRECENALINSLPIDQLLNKATSIKLRNQLDFIELSQLLEISDDSPTGLVWKVSDGKRKKGKPAGSLKQNGYYSVRVNSVSYQNSRVIMCLHTGYDIEDGFCVDHLDRDKTNNKVSNLRVVSYSENIENRGIQKNNNSGVPGLYWSTRDCAWIVNITRCGSKYTKYFTATKLFPNVEIETAKELSKELAVSYMESIKI